MRKIFLYNLLDLMYDPFATDFCTILSMLGCTRFLPGPRDLGVCQSKVITNIQYSTISVWIVVCDEFS